MQTDSKKHITPTDANTVLAAVLPCPFCGGTPYEGKAQGWQYTIRCYNCGVVMMHDRRDKVRGALEPAA